VKELKEGIHPKYYQTVINALVEQLMKQVPQRKD